ncbi:uncharacterized protein LOC115753554 isoform X2 [Rhodamnia argentea]|uniref:Uncharacterized protein LOC115753554 isoform X1 n=1 Tax=Rhodamnia argentea TaxID=178133 RepID=A0A8B8QLJ9_9MYRT|nr:uncharacterized protein LOC115753554 isoform X1 [Rhodamnia argentea]XP_048132657.1 uncharacterized protein LOC115753554 isoform X2 [Rhodamnia argentea]
MARRSVASPSSSRVPTGLLLVLISCVSACCSSLDSDLNTFTASSFSYPETRLRPYDLRYIRVDLPPWFSSLSITLESDVDLGIESIEQVPKGTLPMICFREGSPPLPDVSNTSVNGLVLGSLSNQSIEWIQGLQNVEQCYPMQKNITIRLTNEQISSGVWYFGLFNGIGPMRTQSKMIVRGPAYSFSANVSVEGCKASGMWGQNCNQTVDSLPCSPLDSSNIMGSLPYVSYNQTRGSVLSCKSSFQTSCFRNNEVKVYTVDIVEMSEELSIIAKNLSFSSALSSNTGSVGNFSLLCLARYGGIASAALNDYSGTLDGEPFVIQLPRVGRWFITILSANLSIDQGGIKVSNMTVCYSLEVQIAECSVAKAGPNCMWEKYVLQTFLRISVPFESYYLPVSEKMSSNSANFLLEPLISNISSGELNNTWTYFLLDVPHGAAGGNIHVRLSSDTKINYEIYARFGGLPSLYSWDYYYANKTSSSDGSMFFKMYNSSEEKIDFYILYAREGTWSFGLRHVISSSSKDQTTMSLSLERCPRRCSSHGDCKSALDASGLTTYSFCSCDRNHGGFDCSIEIVSHQGHVLQSVFLIASNAAAILPAYWALRQKAFAEWVLFTSSGISSGLYHACDVGTWCALSFSVLQFMDFWLSFMAVVSTFVYLTTINEVHKRTIHTAVAILTALLAVTKATRSANIMLVMAIGALGLLVGWLIELSTKYRSLSSSFGLCLNMLDRWQYIREWLRNLVKTFFRRFRWGFLIAGFLALTMAGISWKLETSESYWIWHSLWHVTIYTSSFFFLCSKANPINVDDQRPPDGNYELTRQDSFSRVE